MRIDNFYFVVENIEKSIEFYSKLLEKNPSTIRENRWADWENEDNKIYFGIISKEAASPVTITSVLSQIISFTKSEME